MNAALAIAALLLATSAHAEPAAAPVGAAQFCIRNPSFCDPHDAASAPQSAFAAISSINRKVNDGILPAPLNTPDEKRAENGNWRVVMPGGLGVCVEYAWTKYLLLAWDGIPQGAMQFAQVKTASGDLHGVLLVRVNGVPVVLDNLTPVIWPADMTHYRFLAVQNGWKWESTP